jgi:acetoin utilization deacetylase AcuC-like enzyme
MKIFSHPVFYKHDTGIGHPENAGRIDAAVEGIRRAGFSITHDAPAHDDTERIIAKVHSADYQQQLDEACRSGMRLFHSLDNPISSNTFAAARAAVSTALHAAEAMLAGERSFVIARPPGHHAERLQAMGFCFFNTIACVAEWLRERPEAGRVFIFDFDVHHGNGTQHIFEEREDVYYASIHRFPFYPGTGSRNEIGIDAGRGYTKNIPLPEGAGDSAYMYAVEEVIMRVIDQYRPGTILLSAGFDAHRRDPLGGMNVSEQIYGEITRRIVEAANKHSNGRVLSLLEGGYDMEGLSASVAEHVNALR